MERHFVTASGGRGRSAFVHSKQRPSDDPDAAFAQMGQALARAQATIAAIPQDIVAALTPKIDELRAAQTMRERDRAALTVHSRFSAPN